MAGGGEAAGSRLRAQGAGGTAPAVGRRGLTEVCLLSTAEPDPLKCWASGCVTYISVRKKHMRVFVEETGGEGTGTAPWVRLSPGHGGVKLRLWAEDAPTPSSDRSGQSWEKEDVGGAPHQGTGSPRRPGLCRAENPPASHLLRPPGHGGEPLAQALFTTSQALLRAALGMEEPPGRGQHVSGREGSVWNEPLRTASQAPATLPGFGGAARRPCLLRVTGAPLILPWDRSVIPTGKRQPRGKEASAGPHEVSGGCPTPTRACRAHG